MKFATFNINNVAKRFDVLATWLKKARPDVVCLQELKSAHEQFPADRLRGLRSGLEMPARGWNGVAILARNAEPVLTNDTRC